MNIGLTAFKIVSTFVIMLVIYITLIANSDCNRLNCADGSVCLVWSILLVGELMLLAIVWSIEGIKWEKLGHSG